MKPKSQGRREAGHLERKGLTSLVAGLCALAAAGVARAAPEFPTAQDTDVLAAWLVEAAGVSPDQVIAVTPLTATAIVSPRPAPGVGGEVTLLAQALTREAAARGGVLAWEMRLSVDCRRGLVRLGPTTGYPDRRAASEAIELAPAETAWRRPAADTALYDAWRAVCDPGFQPPFGAGRVAASEPPVAVRASLSIPEPISRQAPLRQDIQRPVVRAAAAPARTPVAKPGSLEAQVLSASSVDGSRAELAVLSGRFARTFVGRKIRIEIASVGGRTVYRGLVAGFSSRAEIMAFCQTLRSGGQACFAR